MKSFGHDQKGGFLGVEAKDISEQMLEYFDVKHGVLVEGVIDETPAQKAGIKAGDVITKINDREIKDYSDLIRTLNFYNPGEKVTLNYVRKGKKKSEKLELAEKKGFAYKYSVMPDLLHRACYIRQSKWMADHIRLSGILKMVKIWKSCMKKQSVLRRNGKL